MADIEFYGVGSEDTLESDDDAGGVFEDYDTEPCEPCEDDAGLSNLQRLEKYSQDENMYTRQMVARGLLETIRTLEFEEDADRLLQAMTRLADDPEAMVRSELMEQVPHIAIFCQENSNLFSDPIKTYILPIVVKYLTDSNNQVRKTSQAALLVLLDQDMIAKGDVEEQVCPVILQLANPDSGDDFRTEAVALMSKLAPLVGCETTKNLFLPRFANLCLDPLFHVRKVCATNFGDFCQVVGNESTEKVLMQRFFYLCEDGVWGVRKACAECFMQVSCCCSPSVRRHELAQVFVNLICDQSRWVRMSAFQALGAFISTFADTGVLDDEGYLVVETRNESESKTAAGNDNNPASDSGTAAKDGEKANNVCDNPGGEASRGGDCSGSSQGDSGALPSDSPSAPPSTESNCEPVAMEVEEEASDPAAAAAAAGDTPTPTLTAPSLPSAPEKSPEEKRAEAYRDSEGRDSSSSDDSSNVSNSTSSGKSTPSSLVGGTEAGGEAAVAADSSSQGSHSGASASSSPAATTTTEAASEHSASNNNSSDGGDSQCEARSPPDSQCSLTDKPASTADADAKNVLVHVDNSSAFSSFQYWRLPLPEIDVKVDIDAKGKATNIHVQAKVQDAEQQRTVISTFDVHVTKDGKQTVTSSSTSSEGCDAAISRLAEEIGRARLDQLTAEAAAAGSAGSAGEDRKEDEADDEDDDDDDDDDIDDDDVRIHTACVSTVCEGVEEFAANIGSTHILGQHVSQATMAVKDGVVQDVSGSSSLSYVPVDESLAASSRASGDQQPRDEPVTHPDQDVIPQPLLDHYLSMTDPSRAQTVDAEIAKHCAYSLPAVAYTLGRSHWPCIKELYETLAGDMQWKVRRTLAFSIHELAVIVGEEVTARDLVPVFNGFLKDLDEVRIGVLKHLADFLRILSPEARRDYLSKINDFLNTDNNRNWRFREEVASQLVQLLDLFNAQDITEYLLPVAFTLAEDAVAAVRHQAFQVLSSTLSHLAAAGDEQALAALVNELKTRFASHDKWSRRQMYAHICGHLLEEQGVTSDRFAADLLPSLLSLTQDTVPNVRITLARTLARHVVHSDYYTSGQNPHHGDLLQAVQALRADCDRDVRYYFLQLEETDLGQDTIPV